MGKAVPISVIEDIKSELQKRKTECESDDNWDYLNASKAEAFTETIAIIDSYISKEVT